MGSAALVPWQRRDNAEAMRSPPTRYREVILTSSLRSNALTEHYPVATLARNLFTSVGDRNQMTGFEVAASSFMIFGLLRLG